MSRRRRRKCRHCGQLLRPDPRNVRHQRYCPAEVCRRARKAASQRRWLAKAANRDYFRGPEHVARVRAWRASHPARLLMTADRKAIPLVPPYLGCELPQPLAPCRIRPGPVTSVNTSSAFGGSGVSFRPRLGQTHTGTRLTRQRK